MECNSWNGFEKMIYLLFERWCGRWSHSWSTYSSTWSSSSNCNYDGAIKKATTTTYTPSRLRSKSWWWSWWQWRIGSLCFSCRLGTCETCRCHSTPQMARGYEWRIVGDWEKQYMTAHWSSKRTQSDWCEVGVQD